MIDLFTMLVSWGLSSIGWILSAVFSLIGLVILLPLVILWFWAFVRILNKMGYSGWWSLLTFIPPLSLVALWIVAFADWPSQRRLITVIPPR
ncbi:hypothetical protein ACFSM5_04500 [Lacibacterium aquatile]|uniref:DUF805 domain-containing protein n=1 Tax=Lacibacterium aquatile TaxID=1168082 RepID=A0ABW5DNQ9_9PROT